MRECNPLSVKYFFNPQNLHYVWNRTICGEGLLGKKCFSPKTSDQACLHYVQLQATGSRGRAVCAENSMFSPPAWSSWSRTDTNSSIPFLIWDSGNCSSPLLTQSREKGELRSDECWIPRGFDTVGRN